MARVLLIEPDRLLGASTKTVLKRAGHNVDLHVDPQAAMDSADGARPDLIILDLLLAGRSGIEFLYEFRSYPDWANVPVVIYSTLPKEEFHEASLGVKYLNIAAYHYKPETSLAELCESAQRILQPTLG